MHGLQKKRELVLASASPRRSQLLRNAGIAFTAVPANISEERRGHESGFEYARRIAREKAASIFALRPSQLVLGADTVVIAGDQVLGKPRDPGDAGRMLHLLSGRSHLVTTAVCLFSPGEHRPSEAAETTEVWMESLSTLDIENYVASGEPMDKAGAYAIQGRASCWITKIAGCYFNVVGLPVALVCKMLRQRGFEVG